MLAFMMLLLEAKMKTFFNFLTELDRTLFFDRTLIVFLTERRLELTVIPQVHQVSTVDACLRRQDILQFSN
jgi:hypothetical protein